MKQPRLIQRLSGITLAVLLLVTAMWGPGSLTGRHVPMTAKAPAGLAKTQKTNRQETGKAQLSAKTLEAVVTPAVTLDGGSQTAFLLPAPALIILLLLSVLLLRHFTLPHFYFSYFRHVFGHHIATNAP